MNEQYIFEVNEQWKKFKQTFAKKNFPTDEMKTFFTNAAITHVEDISSENDGLWSILLKMKDPESQHEFSLVIDHYGYVSNMKGHYIMNQLQGSDNYKWEVINRIFEHFKPLLAVSIYFAKLIAI